MLKFRRDAHCVTGANSAVGSSGGQAIIQWIFQGLCSLALGLLVIASPAHAQMFLDEGDEMSEMEVKDSVTSSPQASSTEKSRTPQSKAAWSEKRKAHTAQRASARQASAQKTSTHKSAYDSASKPGRKSAKKSAQQPVEMMAEQNDQAATPETPQASKVKSVAKAQSTSKSNKSRSPASTSNFAVTKKSCPLQISPGAAESIGNTRVARKIWVRDAGDPAYFKVVNREGREGFVKRSCFQ